MNDPLRQQLQSSLGTAYTLERELGGGGMSRVFVAEETRFGRRVVVKLLSPELAAGLSAERFELEIALAAKLQHPHIVPLLTAGASDGLPYYTMPFVEGESLRTRLEAGGASPSGRARIACSQPTLTTLSGRVAPTVSTITKRSPSALTSQVCVRPSFASVGLL